MTVCARTRRNVWVLLVFFVLPHAACSGGPTFPSGDGWATGLSTGPPALQMPQPETFVRQNDAASGCPTDPYWGRGFRVSFAWSDVRGAAGYRLNLVHPTESEPLVDERVSETRLELQRCTTIIDDATRMGWQWKVRAILPDGSEGAWSQTRTINFLSCRMDDRDGEPVPCGSVTE